MSVISVSYLGKSYGSEDIFSGISFHLSHRARVAVVGPNGIGKTTLLRILAGEESPSDGTVHIAKGINIGYLPQEAGIDSRKTLYEECLAAVQSLLDQEADLKRLEIELGKDPENKELLDSYGNLQSKFEHAGGYTYESQIDQVLSGLGFTKADYEQPLNLLSGGQRTRALLAHLLLSKPDLLILDEPTNHLDIQAVEWLESYLGKWHGTVLIVSHDRYFLDQVVDKIWEMSAIGFETFRGNYSKYLQQRVERWTERKQYINREIARMQKEIDYIRKNIAGQRTQMAKGKLSRLSRELVAIEKLGFLAVRDKQWAKVANQTKIERRPMRVEEAARRISALRIPDEGFKTANLSIRPKQRSGNIILRTAEVLVGYPEKPLFQSENIELHRLECAALIGPNGAGKTTFLRTILEQMPPLEGETVLGAGLEIGYFAQAHEDLDPKLTLIEEIDKLGTPMLEKDIRSYLGRFLFSGDDQYKKVSVLSGGERGRLALAKLSLSNANLLLLDEPSNHLDIPAQEVLQQVLSEFEGTIIMVSHDRYLINTLATQIWEIDPKNKFLKVFTGSYKEYRSGEESERANGNMPDDSPIVISPENEKEISKPISKHQLQRHQKKINLLEDRILEIEKALESLAKKLQTPPKDPKEVQSLGEEYAYLEVELEEALAKWEEYQTQLE